MSRSKKRRARRIKLYAARTQIDLNPKLEDVDSTQEPETEPTDDGKVKLGGRTPIILNPNTSDTELDQDPESKDAAQAPRTLVERKRRRKKIGRLINDPNDGTVPEPSLLTERQKMRLEHCKLAMELINKAIGPAVQGRARTIHRLLKEKCSENIQPLDEVSKAKLIRYINHAFATKPSNYDRLRKRTRGMIAATRKLGGKHVFDKGATIDNSSRVPARD